MNFKINHNSSFKYIVIIILSIILYGNTIQNNYSIDDELITSVFKNKTPTIKDIFTSYTFSDKTKDMNFAYRPILLSSFALEKMLLGKLNAHFSHFVNLLFIILIFCLVYYFLSQLFIDENSLIILFSISIFIAHPLLTELINNIKSRDELLVILFGTLSIITYLKFLKSRNYYLVLLILVFFIFGILSKKSFLVFSFLLPLTYIYYSKKILSKELIISVIFALLPLFIIFIVKKSFLSETALIRNYQYFENPLYSMSLIDRISTGFTVPLYYIKLFFIPNKLSFYYGYNTVTLQTFTSILPYISLAFYSLLLLVSVKTFKKHKMLSFGILLVLLQSAAVSNIFIVLPGIIAERFYFIGTLGMSIITAQLLYYFAKKLKIINYKFVYILPLFIILPLFVLTIKRNTKWKDSFTLFNADIGHLKNSVKANELTASVYLKKYSETKNISYLNKAEKYSKNAVKIYPEYASIWNNLGFIYFTKQSYKEAEKAYLNSIKYSTNNANPYYNLALLYNKTNNIEKAKLNYLKVLETNPNLPNYLPYLKQFILKNNFTKVFINKLEQLLNSSYNYNLEILIIDLYNSQADYEKMMKHLLIVNKNNPSASITKLIEQTQLQL